MKKLALIYDEKCSMHKPALYHAENPDRFTSILNYLKEKSFLELVDIYAPSPAADEQILMVHSARHFEYVKSVIANGGGMLDEDTYADSDSLLPALLAAGSVIKAVDLILENKNKYAVSLMRPPGHHAETDRPMGFCLFNNVAIGAKYALEKKEINKAAIVDFDVHHGNGTQEIFYGSPDVLFISLHQFPLYPGTGKENEKGRGEGEGFTINFPLPPGTGGGVYHKIFKEQIIPALEKFNPGLLFISAGFDAHKDDPLAQMKLVEDDFSIMTSELKNFADKNGIGIISVLEGGYNLEALPKSVYAHLQILNQ
ncbi:MAG: histone deacetylase [Ignavibacteriaceae bacterium]